jgi:hypothetical protein
VSAADTSVKLLSLIESRELSLEKTPFSGWQNEVTLTLHIDGPGIAGARKFGRLVIAKAVDDAGTDLTRRPENAPPRGADEFQDIRTPQTFDDTAPKPTGFDLEVKLPTLSARKATKLARLSGTVRVLVGGEKRIVTVRPIPPQYGKSIEDPSLEATGVTFTISDPAKRGPGERLMGGSNSVSAVIKGPMDEIAGVRIVDAGGEDCSSGSFWSDDKGVRTITYLLNKPLANDMGLEIEVWPGQKTVTVPIELEDVTLP